MKVLIPGHIVTLLAYGFLSGIAVGAGTEYRSPLSLAARGNTLYVAESSASQVAVVDAAKAIVTGHIRLDRNPTGLALSADGQVLFVTGDGPDSAVYLIDTGTRTVTASIDLGHTPLSPVPSPDGKLLYVCNRFDNDVAVVDLTQKRVITRIPVTREPVAAVLSLDGSTLFVANHLPTGAANVDRMASVIDVIDTVTHKLVRSIPLPNGAIDLRSMALSPDGVHLYVPSIFARFLVPTAQIERGWINTHALNILSVEQRDLLWTVLLDDVDRGAANPWGVVTSPDGKTLCVSHAATHEVSLIDTEALMAKLALIPARATAGLSVDAYESLPENPANSLSFLTGIRRRIALPGNGPRGVTIVGDELAVAEYFSDSVALVALNPASSAIRTIALGTGREMDIVRKGHLYFEDASLCFQQWHSCSTCHPDVRTDAVNWDLLNDGLGNPKNTKSLLLSHKTPPAMITGIRAHAGVAVRAGIRYIQFAMPDEEKATAIDAFLTALQPIPSPKLIRGKLSDAARRGQALFTQSGCIDCHDGPYRTNLLAIDVGTTDGMEKGRPLDTPTLIEVWRTAPYLYDGRAATLHDVLTTFNPHDRHGRTSHLNDAQLADLSEYILSL